MDKITEEDILNATCVLNILSGNAEDTPPSFTVKCAVDTDNYITECPEDMIECRTSWNDLYSKMLTFQNAFEEIFWELVRTGEKINYDQCSIEIKD